MLRRVILAFVLVAATLLVYVRMASADFQGFDDPMYITDNWYTLQGLSWEGVKWAWTNTEAANWHPVTWLSHMADVELFGVSPRAMHLENVALHIATVVLVYALLLRARNLRHWAFPVALIVAVHPLNVENVAWLAERKSLLAIPLMLMSFHCYCDYAENRSWRSYGFMFIAFCLSLMAKAMSVSFPLLLLIWDYGVIEKIRFNHDGRTLWHRLVPSGMISAVVEKLPLIAVSMWFSLITIWAQAGAGAVASGASWALHLRLFNAFISVGAYVKQALAPLSIGLFYPQRDLTEIAQYSVEIGMASIVFAGLYFAMKKNRVIASGLLWFLVSLLPVIGVIQVGAQSMADRYFYQPGIGLAIAGMAVGSWMVEAGMVRKLAIQAVGLGYVAFLCSLCYAQTLVWQNGRLLFSSTLANCGDSYVMHINLSAEYADANRIKDGLKVANEGLWLWPDSPMLIGNRALLWMMDGKYDLAYSQLKILEQRGQGGFRNSFQLASLSWQFGNTKAYEHWLNLAKSRVPVRRTMNFGNERIRAYLQDPAFSFDKIGYKFNSIKREQQPLAKVGPLSSSI
jgi:hypothetical protein